MTSNVELLCTQPTDNTEIYILFWTLIVAIASLFVTIIISIIGNHQNAKLNSISMLKHRVGKTFERILLNNFCENVKDCNHRFVSANKTADVIHVSFDKVPLIQLQNKISKFLGKNAYLQYAIPYRYSRLNSMGESIVKFIETEMIPYAIFENAPYIPEQNSEKILEIKKAKKIYRKFLRKIKKFYKKAFQIYKYGL